MAKDAAQQKLLDASRSEDEDVCPICLCPSSAELPFAKAPCQHEYCLPCVERLLLTKQRPPSHRATEMPDAHLAAPTRGRCSICRQEMTLFELKYKDGSNIVVKDPDVASTALHGLTYEESNADFAAMLDDGSVAFSFPGKTGELASYTCSRAGHEPQIKLFDEGCHFHDKSRTFHGQLSWSREDDVAFPESKFAENTDVVLQFSSDWRFIAFGTMVHTPRKDSSKAFPLDGRWRLISQDGTVAHIQVFCSTFMYGPCVCRVDTSNPKQPTFRWLSRDGDFLQKAVSGVDLEATPEGPSVGQSITWTTNAAAEQNTIVWTRESFAREPDVEILGPGGRLFQLRNPPHDDRTMPAYNGTTLFGNTFCQGLKVGLASYQFLDDGTAYISYEHPDCGRWPPLDDGTPVPSRVQFREPQFDAQERVFRGKIKWQEDIGTSWQGCAEWIYEMKFDVEYTCILAGRVLSLAGHGGDAPQEMSTFGLDLIYLNAAIKDRFDAMAEDGFDEMPESPEEENLVMRRYTRVKNAVRHRLQQEQASVRTIALVTHVLTALYDPNTSNPIDFNL